MSLERGSYLRKPEKLHKPTKEIKQIASSFKKDNEANEFRIFVAGGSRSGNDPVYEKEAFKLGEKIAQMDFRLDFYRDFRVLADIFALFQVAQEEGEIKIRLSFISREERTDNIGKTFFYLFGGVFIKSMDGEGIFL